MPRRWLPYAIALIGLMACSPPAPVQLATTIEVGPTASPETDINALPSATVSVSPAPSDARSPLPPSTTQVPASTPPPRLTIVDQSSVIDTSRAGWWSIQALGPTGQTFVPSFAGLDAIELWTEGQADGECTGVGAKLQVNVREAAIDGPLVGTSSPVVISDCFRGITFFGFPTLIALTPGKVHAIEVVVTSENNWGLVWQQVPDAYPQGETIVLGAAGDGDIWFQEGLHNSIPLSEAYCQNDLWQHVKRADGRSFIDPSECGQYVNDRR